MTGQKFQGYSYMDENLLKYREYQRLLLNDIVPSTIHFLQIDKNNIPHPHGSGVLVQIDDHYFVFTAAHVIENADETIGVGFLENNFRTLGGTKLFNKTSDRKTDKQDIGIIHLDDPTVQYLKTLYKFIGKEELGINQDPIFNPQYVAVGYPVTKSKYNAYKNALHSVPFNYITFPVDPQKPIKVDFNAVTQLVIHYDKNAARNYQSGLRQKGPDPYGMSGCGFWHLPVSGFVSGTEEKKLVAILTDWPNGKNCWMGAKIDLFTEIVRQTYDLDIPTSTTIQVNIAD
jgi:hypothetical protein